MPANYDDHGRFIHTCDVCGIDASFGYHVDLSHDALGHWYCGEHRPGIDVIVGEQIAIDSKPEQNDIPRTSKPRSRRRNNAQLGLFDP